MRANCVLPEQRVAVTPIPLKTGRSWSSGRRRYTPGLMAARTARAALSAPSGKVGEPPSKGQIITAFQRSYRSLGATNAVRDFVVYLISLTYPCDWQEDATPIAGPSNRHLADELGIERTQIKNLARRAADLGLIDFKDSPTGARRVVREHPCGPIRYGYGFDLSPLRLRYDEMTAEIGATKERRREGERYRRDILSHRTAIHSLAALAEEVGQDIEAARCAKEAADQLAALKPTQRDPAILAPIFIEIVALHDRLEASLRSIFSVESDPQGPLIPAPITTTTPNESAYATVEVERPLSEPQVDTKADASQRLDAREAERGRYNRDHKGRDASRTDALKGFIASPAFVLKIAAPFRDAVSTSRPTEREIIEAASYIVDRLGISHHAWGQACITMGRYPAAVIVAVIAARHERGEVRNPGGYMRAMINRQVSGELHLDRSLYGLSDRIHRSGATLQ